VEGRVARATLVVDHVDDNGAVRSLCDEALSVVVTL